MKSRKAGMSALRPTFSGDLTPKLQAASVVSGDRIPRDAYCHVAIAVGKRISGLIRRSCFGPNDHPVFVAAGVRQAETRIRCKHEAGRLVNHTASGGPAVVPQWFRRLRGRHSASAAPKCLLVNGLGYCPSWQHFRPTWGIARRSGQVGFGPGRMSKGRHAKDRGEFPEDANMNS